MSLGRKNSVRHRVIGKKWIYLERNTFHTQNAACIKRGECPWKKHTHQAECGPSQKARAPKYGLVSVYGLGNLIG